jgi:hypothetical protein
VQDLTGGPAGEWVGDDRFTTEHIDLLRDVFDSVELAVFERETVVPAVDPVVAFVDSMRGLSESDLPAGVPWDSFLDRVRQRVTDEIRCKGAWRMRNQVGVFTCG